MKKAINKIKKKKITIKTKLFKKKNNNSFVILSSKF